MLIFARFFTTLSLSIFDFNNHKEFHQSYIADEYILQDYMVDRRKSSLDQRMSLVKKNGFKITVDDEILFRNDEKNNNKILRFFVVIVVDVEKNEISKVEKSYEDFKGFEKSMEYLLRESNATVPRLEVQRNEMFNMMAGANQDMFK